MTEPPTTRGHLTPGPQVMVARLPAPDDVAHLVRQLWIPEWDLPAGERVEQLVLGYPASNVVVEPDGVTLYGPTSRASTRVLEGRGWAVGALLRPAGVLLFTERPADLLDGSAPLSAPGLTASVAEAMAADRAERGRAEKGSPGADRTERDRAERDRAESDRAESDRPEVDRTEGSGTETASPETDSLETDRLESYSRESHSREADQVGRH